MAIAGIFPTVARNFVSPANAARGEQYRPGLKNFKSTPLALISKSADNPVALFEQGDHRAFHVHINSLMDAVVLKRPDHLQPRAISDVGQPRIPVPAKVSLQDAAVFSAVEHRAPGFKFAHAIRGFPGVEFGHAPIIDVLASAHRVGEVDLPIVPVIHIGQCSRDASLGHNSVGFAEQ